MSFREFLNRSRNRIRGQVPATPDRSADARLVDTILADCPGLAGLPELEKAQLLVSWAANQLCIALDQASYRGDADSMSAGDVYAEIFRPASGGVSCGGAARFYENLLRLFDRDCFLVNVGIPETVLTHVSVVVPHGGDFYLFDPTFGLVFRHRETGAFATVGDILDDRARQIEVPLRERRFVAASPHALPCRQPPRQEAGRWIYQDLQPGFLAYTLAQWRADEHGLTDRHRAVAELMRHGFFNIGSARDVKKSDAFRSAIAGRGIAILDT